MKDLKLYIHESILDAEDDLDSKDIRVQPKTKKELSDIITDALNNGETNLNFIDTSKITDMSGLFKRINNNVEVKDIDISKWDVSNVINTYSMFSGCNNFTSDLSKWNVCNVEDMFSMFYNCNNFTSDLSGWDVSKVTDMEYMFSSCNKFNSDLSKWDVSNVTSMYSTFINCYKFTSNLSKWDVSNVIDMRYMFQNCFNFTSDLSKWNVSKVRKMLLMFNGSKLEEKNKLPKWYNKKYYG